MYLSLSKGEKRRGVISLSFESVKMELMWTENGSENGFKMNKPYYCPYPQLFPPRFAQESQRLVKMQ